MFYLLNVEKNNIINILFNGYNNLKKRPKLGDFLILENKDSLLLTRVEEENYFLDYNDLKNEILKFMEIGFDKLGELEKEELYRLTYKVIPLTTLSKKERKITGSYRNIPLHLETTIRKPSFEEMLYFLNYEYLKDEFKDFNKFKEFLEENKINENNIKEKEKELLKIFNGEIISYYQNLPVIFNVNKFLAKRTGVFARTGYGKSNAIKIILLKILKLAYFKAFSDKEIKNALIVVYDVNGEYAFTNQQNTGFQEVFKDKEDDFLVLTNKRESYVFVRPLKINFAELSTNEIAEILINAFGEEIKAYTYFEEIDNKIWKNLFALAVSKVKDESKKEEKDFEKKEVEKVSDFIIKYLRKLLQIISSELKFIFEEKLKEMEKEGKFNVVKVVIDLEKEVKLSEELQKKLKKAALQEVNIGAIEWRLKKLLYNLYHPNGLSSNDVKNLIENKKMVILDLSSADDWSGNIISRYFTKKIFEYNQEFFLKNEKYHVILTFEEAQNLLDDINKNNDIFVRVAKEGRKFNIALIAITQQPSSISQKILSQMDNFLAFHLLNEDDINALSKANNHYSGLIKFLLKYEPIKGQCFFYSAPEQPFVIQMKFNLFDDELEKFKKEMEELKKKEKEEEQKLFQDAII
ncbi:MAG: DUF87 domain-containing protein [Nanoarchaeota archaeon]